MRIAGPRPDHAAGAVARRRRPVGLPRGGGRPSRADARRGDRPDARSRSSSPSPTAVALDRWEPVRRAVEPLLVTSQTIPIVAIAPLFVIWFGFGLLPKVLIVVLVDVLPGDHRAARRVRTGRPGGDDPAALAGRDHPADVPRAALAVGAARRCSPGLRISVVYAVIGAIFGEYVGATSGLGIWMKLSQNSFRTDLVFARDPADRDRLVRAVPRGRGAGAAGRAVGTWPCAPSAR